MVHYKLILDTKRFKTDGLYPIAIRITFNQNNTTISTGIRVRAEYWDTNSYQVNKFHPNFQTLNKTITEVYLKVQKAVHELHDSKEFSFQALKDKLDDKPKPNKAEITFFQFSQGLIEEMLKLRQTGNALIYKTAVNRFLGDNRTYMFSDINYKRLNDFKQKLMLDGVKQNSISNYFRTIRAIYNKAIKSGIVDRNLYPFYDITVKQERTAKRSILVDDINRILALDLKKDSVSWHARNYFVLSFCLIGMSFTDLAYIQDKNIINGRLIFKRRKTHKTYDIKLTTQATALLNYYSSAESQYILPVLSSTLVEDSLEAKKVISQWIKTTNKYLKLLGAQSNLESPLTTYVARHSWATTCKRLGYSNELIAEAMGHEYGNKITNIYLDNFDKAVIDELNQKVVDTLIISNFFD